MLHRRVTPTIHRDLLLFSSPRVGLIVRFLQVQVTLIFKWDAQTHFHPFFEMSLWSVTKMSRSRDDNCWICYERFRLYYPTRPIRATLTSINWGCDMEMHSLWVPLSWVYSADEGDSNRRAVCHDSIQTHWLRGLTDEWSPGWIHVWPESQWHCLDILEPSV